MTMNTTDSPMMNRIRELYPICRSLTGRGVRETLALVKRELPDLAIRDVPSGTSVFDWIVPEEWNISDAAVTTTKGERLIDFRTCNLHVVGYSEPIRRRVSKRELLAHLHTLPDRPQWIPYRTSYYKRTWGFCAPHSLLQRLADDTYDITIESTLNKGQLIYGELFIPGRTKDELFFSTHVCHPSLANDNCSGIAVATELAKWIRRSRLRYSSRFVFVPGTIGSLCWLSRNRSALKRIKAGLVITGVGDRGPITYKRSRSGNELIDRVTSYVLRTSGKKHAIEDFTPWGYDERQYGSPGFNVPVGRLSRTPHGTYPEYHTSADNLEFISSASLSESLETLKHIVSLLDEKRRVYVNLFPYGEPQLGKRGLYASTGGQRGKTPPELPLLWVLNQSDGTNSLLDIASRSGFPIGEIGNAAQRLARAGLLKQTGTSHRNNGGGSHEET